MAGELLNQGRERLGAGIRAGRQFGAQSLEKLATSTKNLFRGVDLSADKLHNYGGNDFIRGRVEGAESGSLLKSRFRTPNLISQGKTSAIELKTLSKAVPKLLHGAGFAASALSTYSDVQDILNTQGAERAGNIASATVNAGLLFTGVAGLGNSLGGAVGYLGQKKIQKLLGEENYKAELTLNPIGDAAKLTTQIIGQNFDNRASSQAFKAQQDRYNSPEFKNRLRENRFKTRFGDISPKPIDYGYNLGVRGNIQSVVDAATNQIKTESLISKFGGRTKDDTTYAADSSIEPSQINYFNLYGKSIGFGGAFGARAIGLSTAQGALRAIQNNRNRVAEETIANTSAQRDGYLDAAQRARFVRGGNLADEAENAGRVGGADSIASLGNAARLEGAYSSGAIARPDPELKAISKDDLDKENRSAEFIAIVNRFNSKAITTRGGNQTYNYSNGYIPNFSLSGGAYNQTSSRRGGVGDRMNKILSKVNRLKGYSGGGFSDQILSLFTGQDYDEENPLNLALQREVGALQKGRGISRHLAEGLVFVGNRPEIGGLGVGNYLDEPAGRTSPDLGILQGISRVVRSGANPRQSGAASGYIPSFAAAVTNDELISAIKELSSKIGEQKGNDSKQVNSNQPQSGVDVNHEIQANVNVNLSGAVQGAGQDVERIINEAIATFRADIESKLSQIETNGRFTKTPPVAQKT